MTTPYSEGSPGAKICIIAEAPGGIEMSLGQPLVGPTGQLFDRILKYAGIARSSLYILNVFEERVYKKGNSSNIYDKGGNVLWTSNKGLTLFGIDQSINARDRVIEADYEVIVPMGGAALSLICNKQGIMKWRGSPLMDVYGGRRAIPTIHPSYIIHGNYAHSGVLCRDLKKAARHARDGSVNPPDRELIIDPSYDDIMDYLYSAKMSGLIASDVECLNNQVSCISFSYDPLVAISIPFVGEGGYHKWNENDEAAIWLRIAEILGNPNIAKVNQNILFDVQFMLSQNSIITRGRLDCTMCAFSVMYPDLPKRLDFLLSLYTNEPYYKDDKKIWQKPWIDLPRFWRYNARDSACALELWPLLKAELEEEGYWDTYNDLTIGNFPVLQYMMTRGIKVDIDSLNQYRSKISIDIAIAEKKLSMASDHEFNIDSPKQVMEYFYTHKGLKPYMSRKTGNPTGDDKAMARIWKRYGLQEARLVQEIRGLRKLKRTYLDVGISNDSRLRCSYNPRGTRDGRISSSTFITGEGTNMQNLDPRFKGFLVAD